MTNLRLKDAIEGDLTWEHERSLLTLLSGQTLRWHMHPFMPAQNVADHAWHVAVILGLIDPECTAADLKTALFHDVAELKHGDLSAVLKRADPELALAKEAQESETLRRWTGHDASHSVAMKVADKLAELWQFAIQCRVGNLEAESGFKKHLTWLDAMDLEQFPIAMTIRDAIIRWRYEGSTILREELA